MVCVQTLTSLLIRLIFRLNKLPSSLPFLAHNLVCHSTSIFYSIYLVPIPYSAPMNTAKHHSLR